MTEVSRVEIDLLKGVERQKRSWSDNTLRFAAYQAMAMLSCFVSVLLSDSHFPSFTIC